MFSLDIDLVREIEFSIAECGKQTAILGKRHKPDSCHTFAHEEHAGGIAVFTGIQSPMTQAIGVGLSGAVTAPQLDSLEEFFFSRGSACVLELSPYIDSTLIDLLRYRPYLLAEFSNVLLRNLGEAIATKPDTSALTVRPICPGEERLYTETVAAGFADEVPVTPDLLDAVESFARLPETTSYLAFLEDIPAGGGSVGKHGRVGGLFGASTLPRFRRRGIQSALLSTRMQWLREQSCEFAYVITHPGTSSQRNMEHAGFRSTYSRVKLTRDRP